MDSEGTRICMAGAPAFFCIAEVHGDGGTQRVGLRLLGRTGGLK